MKPERKRVRLWLSALLLGTAVGVLGSRNLHADYYSPFSYSNSYRGYSSYSSRPAPIISLNLDPQASLNTSFRIAAREDRVEDFEDLLKRGADINSRSDRGATALHYAARNCSTYAVEELLRLHARADVKDDRGRTPLVYAVEEDCSEVTQILLPRMSPRTLRWVDRDGKTPFDYALTSPVIQELLENRLNAPGQPSLPLRHASHRPRRSTLESNERKSG